MKYLQALLLIFILILAFIIGSLKAELNDKNSIIKEQEKKLIAKLD